ncbi:lysylphosphatidylglycerol synthase transmembrane domain-containing protein [Streptomyces rugosispiralis]|uniref:Flippase-like domain-containing protein n=1 Tax=Streptomyces rugosispiralis TaxID=2967341 RepID=A0ABT1UQ13_9ACTN|nr:lysylphosphatidylglycerol synthase transmembrane domain-containing protein [Streptomyces rugosispiralis]MCQ8187226.1 flippase-like domain-containing protein [Streptomyces rugosispiralis]
MPEAMPRPAEQPLDRPAERAERRPLYRRLPLRQILCLLPLLVVGVWVVQHRSLIGSGARQMFTANPYWLLTAVATTGLGWVAVSFARQGTVLERLPARRLFATQFAAGAANHLLPSGIGAGAVNIRFMTGCGLPPARSSAALALYFLAEATARVGLLLVLLMAFPEALRLGPLLPDSVSGMVVTGVVAAAGVLVAGVALIRPVRRLVVTFLRTALADARSLHMRPSRALALWGGSLAFPLLQAAGLVAVALALELEVRPAHVMLAYLAATAVAAVVPAPGGIGSVDAALVIALVAAGAPVESATSTVLAYRFITVWLPLIPGALVLGGLVRWKIV